MSKKNLEIAKKYYEGWENSDDKLLNLAPDLKFKSPEGNYSSAEEFLKACWQYSGIQMLNKIFLADGDNVCVKYEIPVTEGDLIPCVEWLVFKDGMISEILVFYYKSDQ